MLPSSKLRDIKDIDVTWSTIDLEEDEMDHPPEDIESGLYPPRHALSTEEPRNKSIFESIRSTTSTVSRDLTDECGNKKLKILALHGKSSNAEVTKLQLANLGITDGEYCIVYLDGPILEQVGDPETVGPGFVAGPFYSWFNGNYSDSTFRPTFLRAVAKVLMAVQTLGPFDAIYGFSQGATVAAFAALSFSDIELQNTIKKSFIPQPALTRLLASISETEPTANGLPSNTDTLHFQVKGRQLRSRGSKKRSSLLLKKSVSTEGGLRVNFFTEDPFRFMLLACNVHDHAVVAKVLGLKGSHDRTVRIPSMHLIGISDPRKQMTERMVPMFFDAQVKYFVGGHAVDRMVSSDGDLLYTIKKCLMACQNVVEMSPPEMKKTSDCSRMGLMQWVQVAHVELDERELANETLLNSLSRKDPEAALLYNARENIGTNYTSYGDVLDFIQGGAGDLRHIHVNEGEVVAYGAPPGGGAVSALAFISIMAQTTAAPLPPNSQESDALYFLEQINAKHLILFEGVENPGLETAFEKYAASGKAVLHKATIEIGGKPGIFHYTKSAQQIRNYWFLSTKMLRNPPDAIGLLLSTSGTTSTPKGFPILHRSLIQNGDIIASSLELRKSDVCYSIMPLFHIGGISASILCSIAAGSSICCDNEAYNPENMVAALALSKPKPTWYSAVPTIHNATVSFIREMAGSSDKLKSFGISENGIWEDGHSLRMIRSGAAALLGPDAMKLTETYGNIPVIPTYSMSEQMPITQPPAGKKDMLTDKPGSVGVPVAASLAVVNSSTLRPQLFGREGEIAICGTTVIDRYLNNEEADKKSFFELTLPTDASCKAGRGRFFLTGDIGILDKDGFLTLLGRNKELIKKGGEQISPFEVEEPLLDHPWVRTAVCFAVSSLIYGEEAGAAIILSPDAPSDLTTNDVMREMRSWLRDKNVSAAKWPTRWKVVQDDDLLKTKTNKYIRAGLSEHLGLEVDPKTLARPIADTKQSGNTFIDWDVISGLRFLLACYVMFMHIGSSESWGAFNNLRGWPWHVHVFFTLGGFSLAAPMNPIIEKKFKYFWARISVMYPAYAAALIFVFANLLVTCRPSTFRSDFHWDAQPDDLYIDGDKSKGVSPLFCEGTPATPKSYWASLILTILVYATGCTITPIFLLNWWMGYYFWFSAMYYQCLMIFPAMYNYLATWRSDTRRYSLMLVALFLLNFAILLVTWFVSKDNEGYNHYDETTGLKNADADAHEDAHKHNVTILSWYLFSPFWILYFLIGAVAAFLYDAYRPVEKRNNQVWGYIADGCTLIIVIWSIVLVSQGNIGDDFDTEYHLRPDEANNYTDTAQTNRLWDNICGRLVAPLTTLWIFALSTGEGRTASMLRVEFLVDAIAPHSYNCFLFHQPVAQWYYAITRNGHWWNWWRYRKTQYWFSPAPLPVAWHEYFYLVVLTVGFSALVNSKVMPLISRGISFVRGVALGDVLEDGDKFNMKNTLLDAIEDMTGLTPELDWTLDQCGLSSVGLPQLARRLQIALSKKNIQMAVSAGALSSARTVGDILELLQDVQDESNANAV